MNELTNDVTDENVIHELTDDQLQSVNGGYWHCIPHGDHWHCHWHDPVFTI
ncbi:MAG: bacteriocin [Burkholderiales bacterium]|nr:bacteriocin [Burkholderiales bacterium]MDR4517411.1 bacteriocin [Nitrosomonas sp.]